MKVFTVVLLFCFTSEANGATDPNDLKILRDFEKGLENPELLKWPENDDNPCGPPKWPHVFCSGQRVTQIQVQNLGLKGPLPQNFNQLDKLYNLGLQRNNFTGKLPTFSGLADLQFAYLDYNEFDTIPSDFFKGLNSLRVMALDNNPLNATTGWSLPRDLQNSVQLSNLSLVQSNLVGPLPDFLATLPLQALKLSYNRLSGGIPEAFRKSTLQIFWLNNQDGGGMSGPIDVIASMTMLTQLWLNGNQFTGSIPDNIGDLTSLKDLNLNGNMLVGLIPQSLADMELEKLDLNNNMLMGPIPKFKSGNVTYASNSFCQSDPGAPCAPQVNALLEFLNSVNYPKNLASEWTGNDPCQGPWLGLTCTRNSQVSIINLPKYKLNGTLSPSIAKLESLLEIRLGDNNLNGSIPRNLTNLKSLRMLDLSGNNFGPPLPEFHDSVKLNITGNPLLNDAKKTPPTPRSPSPQGPPESPPPSPSPQGPPESPPPTPSPPIFKSPPPHTPDSTLETKYQKSSRHNVVIIVVVAATAAVVLLLLIFLSVCCCKKRKRTSDAPGSMVVHPRDPSDPDNLVKVAVSDNTSNSLFTQAGSSTGSVNSSGMNTSHVIESGNLLISVQVLQKVTNNFAPANEVGRGGFGTVYKGELEDGTKIAVKRMEATVVSSKALDEFCAEIAVLSKVRHRHLVSLLGYSIEGYERLLVYEFMPQGALMTGKVTTKVDVFSYGVVLVELLTGLVALDEDRPAETRYLVEWFWKIRSDKERLLAAIDPALDAKEEILESIFTIVELAGHCTARDPHHRPDMSHAVSVLTQLVEGWKPIDDEAEEECSGIDYTLGLPGMLKAWKESEVGDGIYTSLDDSKGSIPARPTGFAESFTSADGR
ncbi:Leucine-rich repeat-containing N-terminal, plant-type [Dillenia turbinata]|uniref:Leucine-rich repeat-containing N-terminal, plant-type n=1 Tax=Dillenia turbinata TaxID=194707 RepID=A0AAN8VAC4_9MAGN